jgi:hypothetical protein
MARRFGVSRATISSTLGVAAPRSVSRAGLRMAEQTGTAQQALLSSRCGPRWTGGPATSVAQLPAAKRALISCSASDVLGSRRRRWGVPDVARASRTVGRRESGSRA